MFKCRDSLRRGCPMCRTSYPSAKLDTHQRFAGGFLSCACATDKIRKIRRFWHHQHIFLNAVINAVTRGRYRSSMSLRKMSGSRVHDPRLGLRFLSTLQNIKGFSPFIYGVATSGRGVLTRSVGRYHTRIAGLQSVAATKLVALKRDNKTKCVTAHAVSMTKRLFVETVDPSNSKTTRASDRALNSSSAVETGQAQHAF